MIYTFQGTNCHKGKDRFSKFGARYSHVSVSMKLNTLNMCITNRRIFCGACVNTIFFHKTTTGWWLSCGSILSKTKGNRDACVKQSGVYISSQVVIYTFQGTNCHKGKDRFSKFGARYSHVSVPMKLNTLNMCITNRRIFCGACVNAIFFHKTTTGWWSSCGSILSKTKGNKI